MDAIVQQADVFVAEVDTLMGYYRNFLLPSQSQAVHTIVEEQKQPELPSPLPGPEASTIPPGTSRADQNIPATTPGLSTETDFSTEAGTWTEPRMDTEELGWGNIPGGIPEPEWNFPGQSVISTFDPEASASAPGLFIDAVHSMEAGAWAEPHQDIEELGLRDIPGGEPRPEWCESM